ncbi:uncharacterized protein LOC125943271 [Dermacentor silvarum]|uniref:uncharacterized protein LOC125943271 n=1 Tax=Dermacentor silvarum TaxID=543639 RepID=UPI002101B4AA|nr:uncharacterized protein LOC125943271 [Dermacentor silvarum]
MALTNRDLFGIARGRCKESFCDCERYSVLRSANIRCDYCDHCPGSHGKLDELDSTPWTGDWHVRGTDATEASEPQDSGGNCANADLCTTAPGETVESSSLQRANDLSLLPTRSTNDPSLLPNTSTRDLSLLPSRSANDLSLPPTRSTNDLPLLPTKSQVRKHVCSACQFTTRYLYGFLRHTKYVHMNKVTLKCTICHMRYAHVKHYKDHIEKSCSSSAVDNRLIPVNTLDLEMSSTQASSQSLCASYVMDAKTSSVNQLTVEANTDISTAETQASSPQLITKLSCLARQLESQHRCTKVAVDAVVHGVANILAAAGVALDVSALHNSSARKALIVPKEYMWLQ